MMMGVNTRALFHGYWTPPHDMPIRKLVVPAVKRKPPTQSTRASLAPSDVLLVLSLT